MDQGEPNERSPLNAIGSLDAPEEYFLAPLPQEDVHEEDLRSLSSKCSRFLQQLSQQFLKCMGVTNINLVYFIMVLSCGIVLALSVAINKPYGINEKYIHYFFVVFMAIGVFWMCMCTFSCCRQCGCCMVRREMGHPIPCYIFFGLTIFCFGSCFVTGIDFLSFFYITGCEDKTLDKNTAKSEFVYNSVKIVFIITQLFFFCRFSGNAFHSGWCTSFFILHIIAVNLTTWVYFIVDEYVEHLSPDYLNCAALNKINKFVQEADMFLYPFNIEYSVMSSVLLLLMWFELKKKTHQGNPTQEQNPNHQGNQPQEQNPNHQGHQPRLDVFRQMKETIYGSAPGMVILIIFVILIVLIGTLGYTHIPSVKAYYGLRIFLFLCLAIACISGLISVPQPRPASQSKLHTKVDSILIMIGVSGCYVMTFFQFISATSDKERCTPMSAIINSSSSNLVDSSNNSMQYCKYLGLFIADTSVCLLQFSLQAVFIVKALRCGSEEVSQTTNLSLFVVRNASVVLSIANLGIWIMDTLELKDIKTLHTIENSAYGESTWQILVHIFFPLCVFFRLHSMFCFIEIAINRFGVTAQPRRGNYGRIGSSQFELSLSDPVQ